MARGNKTTNFAREVADHSDKIFRFMDLPAELRNNIYQYLLIASNDIRISRHQAKTGALRISGRKPGTPRSKWSIKAVTIIDRKARIRKLHLRQEHPLALLRVNKAINTGATPVFYGANLFTFENAYAIDEFRSVSGSNFGLVKDVYIKSVTKKGTGRLSHAIYSLKAPTNIKIGGFLRGCFGRDIKRVSSFVFNNIVYGFLMKGWKGPKNDGTESDEDKAEQDRRFAVLHFAVDAGTPIVLEDRTVVRASKDDDLHDVLASAVYHRFQEHVAQKIEQRNRRRSEMLASRASV